MMKYRRSKQVIIFTLVIVLTVTFMNQKSVMREDALERLAAFGDLCSQDCVHMHVGMRVESAEDVRDLAAMLKHLLYHDPYTSFSLHVSAPSSSSSSGPAISSISAVLRNLLRTWEVERVALHIYPPAGPRLYDAIPVILKNLPRSVTKILFIGTKMRFTAPVSEIWRNTAFSDDQFVGFVQSQRTSANNGKCVVCIHDLLLVNVSKARVHFPESFAPSGGSFLNKLQQKHTLKLAKSWFVELSPEFPYTTLQSTNDAKGLYIGGGKQANDFVDNKVITDAREHFDQITNMNGDVFGHVHHICSIPEGQKVKVTEVVKDSCKEYRLEAQAVKRVHMYYIGSPPVSHGPDDVSMLTQLTFDRLSVLETLVTRWEGPIHALLYADDTEAAKLVTKVALSPTLRRHNIAFHVVYRRKMYYPINFLRNVLVNASTTPYLLFNDVDLIPSADSYPKIRGHIQKHMLNRKDITLVVPAFELLYYNGNIPSNRHELLNFMSNGTIIGYRMNQKWNLGHKATDYPKWMKATEPYIVPYVGAFEPYVVLPSKTAPLYDERMLERMGDKIAYGLEVIARGYKLLVLHDCYIVHIPHPVSDGTQQWRTRPGYARCGGLLNTEYKEDLKAKFPHVKLPA